MKLKAQIKETRESYEKLLEQAKREDNTQLENRCLGVLATLDWVIGSRENKEEVIDFQHITHNWE